jgi:hypothetical protein
VKPGRGKEGRRGKKREEGSRRKEWYIDLKKPLF